MIYQSAPTLNSSPFHPVDSSLLECELKAGIRFAPDLIKKKALAEMKDQLGQVVKSSASKIVLPRNSRVGLEAAQHLYVQASHL